MEKKFLKTCFVNGNIKSCAVYLICHQLLQPKVFKHTVQKRSIFYSFYQYVSEINSQTGVLS